MPWRNSGTSAGLLKETEVSLEEVASLAAAAGEDEDVWRSLERKEGEGWRCLEDLAARLVI